MYGIHYSRHSGVLSRITRQQATVLVPGTPFRAQMDLELHLTLKVTSFTPSRHRLPKCRRYLMSQQVLRTTNTPDRAMDFSLSGLSWLCTLPSVVAALLSLCWDPSLRSRDLTTVSQNRCGQGFCGCEDHTYVGILTRRNWRNDCNLRRPHDDIGKSFLPAQRGRSHACGG